MPHGIKHKRIVKKILGDLLDSNGFKYSDEFPDPRINAFRKTIENELLIYARTAGDDKKQNISFSFNWLPSSYIQEAHRLLEIVKQSPGMQLDNAHKHRYTVGFSNGKDGRQLDGLIMTLKYPHILSIGDTDLRIAEWRQARPNDPMLNTSFLTQEELEEKLTHTREALEQYVIPFLDGKIEMPTTRGDRNVNER
jgi:hypothetical protein